MTPTAPSNRIPPMHERELRERLLVRLPGDEPLIYELVGGGGAVLPQLPGSLPVDERPDGDGTTRVPAALFAPVHLMGGGESTAHSVASSSQPMTTTASSATSSNEAGAGTTDDPVNSRVKELLVDAAATALAAVAPSDASYDFDQYALLGSGSSGRLFPPEAEMTYLSAAVHQRLSSLVAGVPPSSSPGDSVLVGQLHAWWEGACGYRAWNRLQTYDPDANRKGRIDWNKVKKDAYDQYGYPKWGNPKGLDVLSWFGPIEYYALLLQFFMFWIDIPTMGSATSPRSGYLEIIDWKRTGGTAGLAKLLTYDYWNGINEAVFSTFTAVPWPTLDPTARPGNYPFVPFAPEAPLFGLRVVHRQTWRRQGYARGGLVRTLPLAPKETKRVSTKITRRTKVSRAFEETVSSETSTERATTTKDTDEVVTEATSKLNKHAEAEVSGGYGEFFQAKVSGGIAEDTGRSSKHTKTQLNEMMAKTASRLRRDTKVTVATETETAFEETTASELTNPNDEIALTYLYHRLQERFRVDTEIAEVNSVVLVPEVLPAWNDLNDAWIRDHVDAIGRVLLDDRFRPVLDTIAAEPEDLDYSGTEVFSQAAKVGTAAASDYKAFTGGLMPDMLASGQQYFAQDFERRANLELDRKRRCHQAAGLVAHVRRNALHYLRAVWAAEDYDQRIQRHGRRMVPTAWVFVPKSGGTADPLEVEGTFVPDPTSVRPLSEVIDPNGPIDWLFNCAIYRLRDDPKLVNLHQALAYLRASYARFAVQVETSQGADVTVRHHVAHTPRRFEDRFSLEWRAKPPQGWALSIFGVPGTTTVKHPVDGALDVRGVKLWLDGTPSAGDRIDVKLRVTPQVEDPHLRLVKLLYPPPAPGDEAEVFTGSLVADMARVLPDAGLPADSGGWANLSSAARASALANYHRYLVLRESGRLVTVDTANLVMDIEASRGGALEPFKRLHRYIDVLKEEEERQRRSLENTRRSRLLAMGRLADPDIEQVRITSRAADDMAITNMPTAEE